MQCAIVQTITNLTTTSMDGVEEVSGEVVADTVADTTPEVTEETA